MIPVCFMKNKRQRHSDRLRRDHTSHHNKAKRLDMIPPAAITKPKDSTWSHQPPLQSQKTWHGDTCHHYKAKRFDVITPASNTKPIDLNWDSNELCNSWGKWFPTGIHDSQLAQERLMTPPPLVVSVKDENRMSSHLTLHSGTSTNWQTDQRRKFLHPVAKSACVWHTHVLRLVLGDQNPPQTAIF